uniref:Kinase suppressor of ras 1b n=1 Tax=Sinocyclocheilus anshuiensis TaxID=1608454 RepID=A0A671R240_9TELE
SLSAYAMINTSSVFQAVPVKLSLDALSPLIMRKDIGLDVTHRFSTKSWLSQMCQVCKKNMMFGVKCKHCKVKCHNKCTKEAPKCRISFAQFPSKIRRTESVPSDINNLCVCVSAYYFQHRQQFVFPGELTILHTTKLCYLILRSLEWNKLVIILLIQDEEQQENDGQDQEGSDDESEGDEVDDLPNCRGYWKDHISRKASQTSVYLQEWDVPFEQLELGELIGKGRWGKVCRGRWHGEVAVRLLEIDGNNQEHLKLFKKEVMNYRQTRHENVVLFMGACMNPPHLAIITSFCKGRTLYSVVRDSKLDINKIRQIAQEIVKGMGYLHAKGIVHKDLKSKNVFYDSNKVVITDFGLFGMSGVVQEDRRENELKLPRGWIYYLAPEVVQKMGPGNQDCLPFSKAADVYAFGTIWYELQAKEWPIVNQPTEVYIYIYIYTHTQNNINMVIVFTLQEILSACWSFKVEDRPTFTQLSDLLEKLPKLNRRLSHPGHFWKSEEYVS